MPLSDTEVIEIGPPPPATGLQWRHALRALRELLNDPDKTEKAFEVFYSINGDREEREFQRFLAQAAGRDRLREHHSLVDVLSDRAALRRMEAGSFGRAYLAYLDANRFEADGLLRLKNDLQRRYLAEGRVSALLDPAREWFRDRGLLSHDLWHVLTGYGTDELGEAALLPFSWAQSGGRANALLVFGVAVRATMAHGFSFLRYLAQAWRRGRRAAPLVLLPYEELLPLPLERVREIARIDPPELAHPGGIRRGSYDRASRRRQTRGPSKLKG